MDKAVEGFDSCRKAIKELLGRSFVKSADHLYLVPGLGLREARDDTTHHSTTYNLLPGIIRETL